MGYSPQNVVEPDPALRHECQHDDGTAHYCHCELREDHTIQQWVSRLPAQTKPIE